MILTRILVLTFTLLAGSFAFADPLSESIDVQFNSAAATELKQKAQTLGTPIKIFEYLRNNAEPVIYHGAHSGSVNTFLSLRGNDVDLASTLIAMFRAENIPARYAVGTVRLPAEKVMNWLGVKNIDLLYSVLRNQGIQNVTLAADKSYIDFEHVWVEALVSYTHYRGAGKDATVRCTVVNDNCDWLPLDPSFKLRLYHEQGIDIYDAVNFDYDKFFHAIKNNDAQYKDKNPLEIFEEQVLAYLRANHPGKTLEDVIDKGTLLPETPGLLPASLPFEVIGDIRRYDNVADHDLKVGTDEVKPWTKNLSITITKQLRDENGNLRDDNGDLILDPENVLFSGTKFALSELSTKRLTVNFHTDDTCSPECVVAEIRLDGNLVESVTKTSDQLQYNDLFLIELVLDASPAPDSVTTESIIDVEYSNNVVGGYYLIGTGGHQSNWSQVHRAANNLLQANQQYAIANDAQGIPFVDANGNGSVDTGEVELLNDRNAMDALTGGLLYTAMQQYFAETHEVIQRLDGLNHVITPINGLLGVTSSVFEVEYLDNTAFSVMPGGLLIDVKGASLNGAWRDNAAETFANKHLDLLTHTSSALEHEVWQKLTGYDAISTVRGIQMALGDGHTLLKAKKDGIGNNMDEIYTALGFSNQPPYPFGTLHIRTLFGTQPHTWSAIIPDVHSFESMRKSITEALLETRAGSLVYISRDNEEFNIVDGFNTIEDQIINTPSGQNAQVAFSYTLDGQSTNVSYNAPVNMVYNLVQGDYERVVNSIGQGFFDYIDGFKGFDPNEEIYRQYPNPFNMHDIAMVKRIRNSVYLSDPSIYHEFIMPSRLTTGATYRFQVYIHKITHADGTGIRQTFAIANKSFVGGGGYVDGEITLEPQNDTTGEDFNNERFTDETLNSFVNNDLVVTPSTVDPVSTVTGNMYHDETDIVIKGRGLNIAFTRTYNSILSDSTHPQGLPLSTGWTHSYNMKLVSNDYGQYPNYPVEQAPENENGTTSSITYVNERGGELNYLVNDLNASYAITPPTGNFDTLQLDSPTVGEHTLEFQNGVKYVFEGGDLKTPGVEARLARIEDPYGNQLTFTYDGSNRLINIDDNINDPARTGLTLTYTADNRIDKITDWTGRVWDFGYDAQGRLTSAANPLTQANTYTYHGETHRIDKIAKPRNNGENHTNFNYYQNGRAFNYTTALGQTETLDYDLYRKRTRITNPKGDVTEHHYDANGALVKLRHPNGGILLFGNTEDGLRNQKIDALGFETNYLYNTDGQVTLETDALNQTIEYSYGLFQQPTHIKDKNGNEVQNIYYQTTDIANGAIRGKLHQRQIKLNGIWVTLTELQYDANGNPKQAIQYVDVSDISRQRITTYSYNTAGLNVEEILISASNTADTIRTAFGYDDLGHQTSRTVYRKSADNSETSLTTTIEYDLLGRTSVVIDPLGNKQETLYDDNGNIFQIKAHYKKPDGTFDTRTLITYTYDAFDRLISVVDIDSNETTFTYDAAGNRTSVTDANGNTSRFEYDSMNRLVKAINANGYATQNRYDLNSRPIQTIDANGNYVTFEYDSLGRRISTRSTLGREIQVQFDANGQPTHIIDANAVAGTQPKNNFNATTYNEYDEFGRVTREVNAENGETLYGYDLAGNITSLTDPEGRTTNFIYDDLGRLIEEQDPLIQTPDKTVTYSYDNIGNIQTKTDRNGETTRYTYDNANRLILTEFLADGTQETRTYDLYGNLSELANQDVTYTYFYDNKNRLTDKIDNRGPNKALTWTYNAIGNVITKVDYQGDVTTYQYDSTNRLVAMTNDAYDQVSYFYDGAGRLINRILANGTVTHYRYDTDNRLITLTNKTPNGTIIHQQNFEHDQVGNITQITDHTGKVIDYTYDPQYRLLNADYPGTTEDYTYTYDKVGNRQTQTHAGQTKHYTYNNGNHLLNIRNTSPTGTIINQYQYDNNGSRVAKLDGTNTPLQTYNYNQKRRVTTITQGKDTYTYKYDPNGHRISNHGPNLAHNYFLQAENLEAVYNDQNLPIQTCLRGVVIDEIVSCINNGTNYTYHHDHLNSVTALTDNAGNPAQTFEYSPFGETLGNGTERMRYTGREADLETDLQYSRARYYDPETGRFITQDPLGFKAGINFYAYVYNNPIRFNDPSGLFSPGAHDAILQNVFGNRLPANEITILQQASRDFDKRTQASDQSHLHSMTQKGQTTADAIQMRDAAINLMMTNAIAAETRDDSLRVFGEAMHPVMDFSSPMHTTQNDEPRVWNPWNPFGHSPTDWIGKETVSHLTPEILSEQSTLLNNAYNEVFGSGPAPMPTKDIIMNFSGHGHQGVTTVTANNFYGGQSGGFVLYPSKVNANMMNQVYAK